MLQHHSVSSILCLHKHNKPLLNNPVSEPFLGQFIGLYWVNSLGELMLGAVFCGCWLLQSIFLMSDLFSGKNELGGPWSAEEWKQTERMKESGWKWGGGAGGVGVVVILSSERPRCHQQVFLLLWWGSLTFPDFHLPHLQNGIDRCPFTENIKNNACKVCIRVADTWYLTQGGSHCLASMLDCSSPDLSSCVCILCYLIFYL